MNYKVNWMAIVACVIACMGIGFLWTRFIQAPWMAGNGITMTDDHSKMLKNGVEIPMSATPMILNTVAMIVYALLINWLINKSNANNLVSGATIGFIIGLISCIQVFIGNLFAANSNTLSNNGRWLLCPGCIYCNRGNIRGLAKEINVL